MSTSGRWRLLLVLVVTAVILLGGGVYVAALLLLPGDGAYILLDSDHPRPLLEVVVRAPQPGGLQTGDQVLALAGRSPDAWLAEVGQPASRTVADTLEYRVLRGGETLTVRQPLARPALWPLLADNWAYFFFDIYMLVVGAVIVSRRPHLPVGHTFLILSAAIVASGGAYFLGLRPSDLRRGWMVLLYLFNVAPLYLGMAAGALHFTLVFPREQPVVRRNPWLVPGLYVFSLAPYTGLVLLGWPAAASNAERLQLLLSTTQIVALGVFIPVVATAWWVLRHTSDPTERRQLRWVAWGIFISIVPWALFSVLPEILGRPSLLPDAVIGLLWCGLPTSLAIAILRERLFDIDLLVNRTLVYGVLSGLLALIYFGAVVVLQAGVGLLTGRRDSQFVIVLSTLAVAAAAAPLRARVQTAIDRRFYRRHYDAGRILAAFSQAARTTVDLEPLSDQLLGVVQETMEPAHLGLTWVERAEPGPASGRPITQEVKPADAVVIFDVH